MRPALLLVSLVATVLVPAEPARAQRVEFEIGGGFVFGGGAEDPAPSLPVFDIGAAAWISRTWGVAIRLVEGPGRDLHEPRAGGDRSFLGTGELHYWAVTARRRYPIGDATSVELGYGLMLDGRFSGVVRFAAEPATTYVQSVFSGFAFEALVRRHLSRHVSLKAGATFDANFETTSLQILGLAVLGL
jgi:hypothetical protein